MHQLDGEDMWLLRSLRREIGRLASLLHARRPDIAFADAVEVAVASADCMRLGASLHRAARMS